MRVATVSVGLLVAGAIGADVAAADAPWAPGVQQSATVSPWQDDEIEAGRPSQQEIAALFDEWNAALATGDPEKVADLYSPDAVLLPTLSP
jgi:hypothetical protein